MTSGIQTAPSDRAGFDVRRVREDFPILARKVHGHPLVYLDSAATTQKPKSVVGAVMRFYGETCANIHRGVHALSAESSRDYEGAREKVRAFVNARSTSEIVFVRGATEAVNLVAATFGRTRVGAGDEVLITNLEHHSNIVPWQMLCQEKGAALKVVPIDDRGELLFDEFVRLLSPRTRIVAVTHVSNALGTVTPVRRIVETAHERGVPTLVDGTQAVPHRAVDVQALDSDFYVFSGHKMYGPTGSGVLYGKEALLEAMPPYQGGGEMIRSVTFARTTYNALPHKFEAGTPDIAAVVGLGAAVDYLKGIGMSAVSAHERDLLEYATNALSGLPGLRIVGTATEKAAVVSFVLDGMHPHDAGTLLDLQGIAVRAGHHCAQPIMDRFGVPATVRASLGLYNTREEIDSLVVGLAKAREVFR